ncbi:MAG: hypothetical protein J6X55_05565, partial [Victivallales bacterium]|nr:hypothetical protein [Victivallales bacterium]
DLIHHLTNLRNIAVQKRKEATELIKTDYSLSDPTGKVKSDKEFQKQQIDKIRDSLRAFRYGLDCATGKSMGKMERMRRYFDQLRSSHKSETLMTENKFNELRRLDLDFNTCLNEIRTRLFGAQQAPNAEQQEKDVYEKVSADVSRTDIMSVDDAKDAATSLSHLTNDRIRYHYSGVEKREQAYLDEINEELGDIAENGGSRDVTFKAGIDALFGLDFKGLELNVKTGVNIAVTAKVSVSTENGSVSVTYSVGGQAKGSATAKFGVDPKSKNPQAGLGAKAEASISGGLTRSVTKTYANLEEFAKTISRLNMVMLPRPREVFYATSKAAIKGIGHLFMLGATAAGFRISRSKMDQVAYSAVLRNRNVFGKMSGVFLKKRNIAVLSERTSLSFKGGVGAKAEGGLYFKTDEDSVDSNLEASGSLGIEYTRELSAKGKLYQSFAASLMNCSAEYLKSNFEFEAAALTVGNWRGDILSIVKNGTGSATAIKENISKLSEILTELEESTVGSGQKDEAFWDDFAAKVRLIAIATALLTKRAEALDATVEGAADAKLTAKAAGEYIIPRLANPVVKIPQKVFKDKFFNIFDITTPRTSRLTGYFSVGIDPLGNYIEEKLDDFGIGEDDANNNPLKGVANTAADGLVGIGKETTGLTTKIEVRVTREKKVSKHNDARPWLNDHKTTVDVRVTASMPIRIIFDIAARHYLKSAGNPDSEESQKFLGEFWDGFKDGLKNTAEDVAIQNASPLLNMTLGDAAKKYPALGKLLGGVDFLTGKYKDDYKFEDDTFKTLRFSFSGDGRFNGLTLTDDYDTEGKLEFTPLEFLSINFSLSSKTSVNDWTVIPRPTVNTLLSRAADYGAAGNPEGFANFLKRNQKGVLRMIQAGRTNAVPANDKYWQKDKVKMNTTFEQCRNLLIEMAAGTGNIAVQAREMQAAFDAVVNEVKNQPADIEPNDALNLAQRFFSMAAQIYTLKAMQG